MTGDVNGDGKPDLAVANSGSDTVSILLGNGDGTFAAALNYGVGSFPRSVALGDINGDGKLDVAVANLGFVRGSVSILLGNGDGTLGAAINYPLGSNTRSIAIGDFNRDGKLDLALTNDASNTFSILLGDGKGTFGTPTNYVTGAIPSSVAVGDFNRDSIPDLAVANEGPSTVSIFLGIGDGTFGAATSYPVGGDSPFSVVVGDFGGKDNNDEKGHE